MKTLNILNNGRVCSHTSPCLSSMSQFTRMHALKSLGHSRAGLRKTHRCKIVVIALGEQILVPSEEPEETEVFSTEQGVVGIVDKESVAEVDFLGESTLGNLKIVSLVKSEGIVNVLGLTRLDGVFDVPYKTLKENTKAFLLEMDTDPSYPGGLPHRAIFCNRTLNLRSIKAIGYDMDYTLIHYDVNAWEGKAYKYGLQFLRESGCPVDGLEFDPNLVIRGLIVDQELGNLVKVDRFGYVKRAMHGTRMMTVQELRETYGRELVNLKNESRWTFLNTLFSVSEAVLYMQMVERLDQGQLPAAVVAPTYAAIYKLVAKALFQTHVEGKLKAEIIEDPKKYVELDPEMALTLMDQRKAGKTLMLITNSDYHYTDAIMSYSYNRYMPEGKRWRDLFDMVIVQARKPDFFNGNMSLYEVVTDDGLMRPAMKARRGGLFCGGSAKQVERALGVEGDDILYVGDHIYTDAAMAKINFRWRTALIVRELEQEIDALAEGRAHRDKLKDMMNKKELVGDVFNQLRLQRERAVAKTRLGHLETQEDEDVNSTLAQLLMVMQRLDSIIGPMLDKDGWVFSERWGYLSRAGMNDKSQFTRQIEKYADVYTSRVANFARYTPFMYFRSPSQPLAHDRHLSDFYKETYVKNLAQVREEFALLVASPQRGGIGTFREESDSESSDNGY